MRHSVAAGMPRMDVTVPHLKETLADGDASKIKNVLEKHSPVEIVDASGKPAVQ